MNDIQSNQAQPVTPPSADSQSQSSQPSYPPLSPVPDPFAANRQQNTGRTYSIGEAANYLNVSIDTIRRWEKKGLLKASRTAGNLRRFTKAELDSFKREAENQDVMMTISEAAKKLGVSIQTLRRWDKSGKLQPRRNAEGQRVYPKKLITYIAEHGIDQSQNADLDGYVAPQQHKPFVPKEIPQSTMKYTPTGVIHEPVTPPKPKQEEYRPANVTAPFTDRPKAASPVQPTPVIPATLHPDILPDDDEPMPKLPVADAKPPQPASTFTQAPKKPDDTPSQEHHNPKPWRHEQTTAIEEKPAQPVVPKLPDELTIRRLAVTTKITQALIEPAQYSEAGDLLRPQIEDHGEDCAGTALLPQGTSKVVVKTSAVKEGSLILLTPKTVTPTPLCAPIAIAGEGFAVVSVTTAPKDISFNWLIIDILAP